VLSAAVVFRLAAQPASGDLAKADDALKAARAAIGAKLSTLQTLSAWGADTRGYQSSHMALTIDLSGKYLREQTTRSTGGEIQRMGTGGDGAGGGMPGDDGGPAMILNLIEGFDGDDYWVRMGMGVGKQSFVNAFARYVLALTLGPPSGFPMTFTYGGRMESPRGTMDALEARGPENFLVHVYLDADAHLPVTLVYHENGHEMQLWLKDYKSEDGIRFPHTLAWLADGNPVEEFQIQHMKVNPKLPPGKFRR